MPSRRPASLWLTSAIAVLLAGAIGFQFFYSLREVPQPRARPRIADVVPRSVAGWAGAEEALGATEAVNAATLKILNLDDYVYRRFQRGAVFFTVYAAYWAPGRMPTRLVASHTPDRCWTENGMRCVDLRFKERYSVAGKPLLPAEYRVFTAGGGGEEARGGRDQETKGQRDQQTRGPENHETKRPRDLAGRADGLGVSGPLSVVSGPLSQVRGPSSGASNRIHVIYWHTVEGKLYDYGERFNAVPSPWLWWKDTLAQAACGSREQLFVRIASETPFEQLWREPGFQSVMESVASLGLWAPAAVAAR